MHLVYAILQSVFVLRTQALISYLYIPLPLAVFVVVRLHHCCSYQGFSLASGDTLRSLSYSMSHIDVRTPACSERE